jgi:hypothetical protein
MRAKAPIMAAIFWPAMPILPQNPTHLTIHG